MRGDFDYVAQHQAYVEAKKLWYVSLLQSDCFWIDLLVNPPFGPDVPSGIKHYLSQLKARVEGSLEKRFIYMYGSRLKVRFDAKPIRRSLFRRSNRLYLRLGQDGRRVSVAWDASRAPHLKGLEVSSTSKFISFRGPKMVWTYSVHDFLQIFGVDVAGGTRIHYVGLTKNPHDRPLSRQHRGYADMLYGVGTDEHDFFLYVSLFKVLSHALNDKYGVDFLIANSMSDEVDVQREGALIETAFIAYFDSRFQNEACGGERAQLRSELGRIEKKGIRAVVLDFELDEPCPYFCFSSDVRSTADRHLFRVCLKQGKLCLDALPATFDAATDLSSMFPNFEK